VPLSIHARPLTADDYTLCQSFDCGDETYQREVTHFLRETYWRGGRPKTEQTFVVVSDEGEIVGYGTWKLRADLKVAGEAFERTVIDIPFFGLDRRFHGEVDLEGRKVAAVQFATLDALARRNPQVEEDTPMHLVVDVANERGQRFWVSRGFVEVERLDFGEVVYLRMIRA
jgi:hypothetical protein